MSFINWLNDQWLWARGFLSETDGKASSKRLVVIIFAVTVAMNYTRLCFAIIGVKDGKLELPGIPESIAIFILVLLGVVTYDGIKKINGKKEDNAAQ